MKTLRDEIEKYVQGKDRIVYLDPSEFAGINHVGDDGKIPSNIAWDPEDLNMAIDLQVIVPSNDDCGQINYHIVSEKNIDDLNNGSVGKWVSFLNGNLQQGENNYLTTDYTNISYSEYKDHRVISKEELGINSIDINFDAHFYPLITIKMTDVRGQSLLTPSESVFDSSVAKAGGYKYADISAAQSFFNSLFRFPYPRFLLSVKGFYGSRVTFTLAVSDFKTEFNSESGDFEITVKFIGYIYGLYADLPFDLIAASPYYNKEYWDTNEAFRYVENNTSGPRILKFHEFLEQLQSLSDNLDVGTLMSNPEVVEYNKVKEEKELLTEIRNLYNSFYSKSKAGSDLFLHGETYDVVFFNNATTIINDYVTLTIPWSFINDSNKDDFKKFKEKITQYFDTYENSKKEFEDTIKLSDEEQKICEGKSDNNETHKILISSPLDLDLNTYQDSISKVYESMNFENGYFKGYNDIWGLNNISLRKADGTELLDVNDNVQLINGAYCNRKKYQELKEKGKEEEAKKYLGNGEKVIIYKYVSFNNFLDKKIKELNEKETSFQKNVSEDLKNVYSNALGFKPSVENIYRMIFAHVDCFMNYFYKTLKNISNDKLTSNRSCKKLGLNDKNSDIRLNTNFVAPFPAYYIDKNGKNMMEYPGNAYDNENLMNIEEVKLTNAIIDSIKTFKNELENVENMPSDDSNEFTTNIMTIMDIFKNNSTIPWKNIELTNDTNLTDATNILYTIVCEYLINKGYDENVFSGKDSLKKWLNNEIKNFKSTKQGQINNINNLSGDFLTILNNGIDNWYNKVKQMWSAPLIDGNKLLFNLNKNNYIIRNYFNVDYDKLPQYFDTAFLPNGKQESPKTLIKDTDSLSIGSFNGVLKKFENETLKREFDEIKNDSLISTDEIFLSETIYLNNLYDFNKLDFEKENEKILNPSVTYLEVDFSMGYITQSDYINNNPSNIHYPFVVIEKKYKINYSEIYNIFDSEIKEKLFNNLCKKNYYSFGYVLLSLMCNVSNFVKNIESLSKKNSFLKIDKLEVLLLGAYLYRLKNDNGNNFFENYKKNNGGLDFLGSEIEDYINNKNWLLKNKEDKLFSTSRKHLELNVDFLSNDEKNIIISFYENWVQTNLMPNYNNLVLNKNNSGTLTYYYSSDTNGGNYTKKELQYFLPDSGPESWLKDLYTSTEYLLFIKKKNDNQTVDISEDDFKTICNAARDLLIENTNDSNTTSDTESNTKETLETSLYYTLKTLYNKWLCSYTENDWKLKTVEEDIALRKKRFQELERTRGNSEYNNFLYIDQFYNDISDSFIINPSTIEKVIGYYQRGNNSYYLYQFLQEIAQENKLLFIALPVFNNLYSKESITKIFSPNNIYDSENDGLGYGNTYILIYTSEVSKQPDLSFDKTYNFNTDYPDIAGVVGPNANAEDLRIISLRTDGSNNYRIPAFGVTFSKQNQMYFKKISVGTDNPRVTMQSIQNTIMISNAGKDGDLQVPSTVGQDIYSIYSNRAYTCTVEMMGCMNIMPMMYFNLNNIPLFRGAYMITNVNHSIQPGDITTTFTGVRVSKYIQPEVSNYIISEELVKKINNARVTEGRISDSSWKNRVSVWKTVFGSEYGNVNHNSITKEFVSKNLIIKIKVPIWTEDVHGNEIHKWEEIEINKNIVDRVKKVFSLLECGKIIIGEQYDDRMNKNLPLTDDSGLTIDNQYLINGEHFIFKTIGTYSFRAAKTTKMKDTATLSNHSFGVAFDINASYNPYIDYVDYNSKVKVKEDTKYCIRTWNHPVVKAFLNNDFGWGIYNSRYDYMHFSFVTSPYSVTTKNYTDAGNYNGGAVLMVGH